MKFEKEFPGLKGKEHTGWIKEIEDMEIQSIGFDKDGCYVDGVEQKVNFVKDTEKSIRVKDVQKHCLDKQRVLDVIDKICFSEEEFDCECWFKLKKELGLEVLK